jgi:hypothetical protein
MPINDEINGAGGVMQQPLAEVDGCGSSEVMQREAFYCARW